MTTPPDVETRVEVVKRRLAFDADPIGFRASYESQEAELSERLRSAKERLHSVAIDDAAVEKASALCQALGTDGLRGELTLVRAARAAASLRGATAVDEAHVREVALLSLRHRLRRAPLDEVGSSVRVERAIAELFGE